MSSLTRPLTLTDLALPRAGALRNVLLVVAASLVTAMAAQLAIRLPWTFVPVTGQTFAVLLVGAALGARRGFLAMALYLAEGSAGLPFFAGGDAGFAKLLGPSGGYLVAFPLAAWLTGALAERGWDRRPLTTFAAMLLGSAVIFALGLAQLSRFVPASALVPSGLAPFVPGDLLKCAIAAGLCPAAWKLAGGPGAR
ncbi:MAG TPA: biotin transporter BioY [Candidatus Acidoferrales bacterium]|nr:biotin transporter BioY [Candidatus Acidoferrales bacterium]